MNARKILGLAALSTVYLAGLAAEVSSSMSAAEILGPVYAEVKTAGKAVRVSEAGTLALLPPLPAAEPFRAAIAAEKPALLVEAVFALPRKAPATEAGRAAELASIYGLLGALNTLEGIQYWSVSRNTWRTFYAESYRVDGPETKRRLPDPPAPKPGAIPPLENATVFQRDLSFGANLYRYSFRGYAEAVSLESTNLTKMSVGPLPVLAVGALKTRVLVVQAVDAILFFVASGAEAPGVFKGRLQESFGNRAEALFRWFQEKSAPFLKP